MDKKEIIEKAIQLDKESLSDDRFNNNVIIVHKDDTICFFTHAFVENVEEWVIILTEHNGFHVYDKEDLSNILTEVPEECYDLEGLKNNVADICVEIKTKKYIKELEARIDYLEPYARSIRDRHNYYDPANRFSDLPEHLQYKKPNNTEQALKDIIEEEKIIAATK